ncbi:plasma membrane ATPase [Diplogelasinospora grovesii]|uniref:Plasma membrane ATPase n=1 Tax=Diplogelasinospora grovesii TaxID=303347 RepID=A0AAN6NJC3_9PEZI|nr:plasma membrane ATPase [Diplogelasinospora grovesii]
MYIGSRESETNFGAVYGALNDTVLTYTYIPRDENDRIISLPKAEARLGRNLRAGRFPALLGQMLQISSITYHTPSHRLLVTSRHPDHFVCTSTPVFAIDEHIDSTPSFSNNLVPHRLEYRRAPKGQVNTCVPAPEAASDLIGVLGTSRGIYMLRHDCTVGLLTPPLSRKGAFMGSPQEKEEHERMSITPAYGGEVFSLDYLRRNPKEVVVAGGRSNRIDLIDMRAPRDEWAWIQHQSSAAHVKSVGDNEILVAGPMSAMSIYDIRYSNKRCSQPSTSTSTYPVVTFPEYKNDAHIHHIGLDVQTDYGVVAAAHDDGRVALYSLYSGTRLRFMPDIDTQGGGNGLLNDRGTAAEPQRPPVVKCLMFQTLPGDRHPSLFVGEGSQIKKYSFGVRDDDDNKKGVATEE